MVNCRRRHRPTRSMLVLLAAAVACSTDPAAVRLESGPPPVELATNVSAPAAAAPAGATTTTPSITSAAPTTSPTTTMAPTTTTIPVVMPLTGLPASEPLLVLRRALVVKIDNHRQARPQFGLNAADIVFEENVEGLTRFAAVFHSTDAERVGPIRSARTQDIVLLGSLNRPLFAWSGGNVGTTTALRASDLVDVGPYATGGSTYYRDTRGSESFEHTLYSGTDRLWRHSPDGFSPPSPQFDYRQEGSPLRGARSSGIDVAMDGVEVGWTWDDDAGRYWRSQDGREHLDASLGPVSAVNVVVLEVDYRPSPADPNSPEAQTVGSGRAWVHSGGVLVDGLWKRSTRLEPFELLDEDGRVIRLAPGRTWVELPRVGRVEPRV